MVIWDVVPEDRCIELGEPMDSETPQLARLLQLAELASVELDGKIIRGSTIEVRCGGRTQTLRVPGSVDMFPDIFVAYLNAELARLGVSERLVCCRDTRHRVVALADPPELARLRMLQLMSTQSMAWPTEADAEDLALLAAIRADPDDDALRLVYADRLAARDDPRGRYIALACSDDPVAGPHARELESLYHCAWTAHLPGWLSSGGFVRGLVEYVQTSEWEFFEHHAEIHAMAPIPRVVTNNYDFILSPDGRLAIARQHERARSYGARGPLYRVLAPAEVSVPDLPVPANEDPGLLRQLDVLATVEALADLGEPFAAIAAYGFTSNSRAAWFRSEAGAVETIPIPDWPG